MFNLAVFKKASIKTVSISMILALLVFVPVSIFGFDKGVIANAGDSSFLNLTKQEVTSTGSTNFIDQYTESKSFIMLNNFRHSQNPTANREEVIVRFAPPSESELELSWLSAGLRLNDHPIAVSGNITEFAGSDGQDAFTFRQTLDLENPLISSDHGETITALEGHYEYTFTYRLRDGSYVSEPKQVKFEFYLMDESNYVTIDEEDPFKGVSPFIYNTEKIEPMTYDIKGDNNDATYTVSTEKNFFNYNNLNNTHEFKYDSNENNDQYLNYPALVFDASRYNVSFSRTVGRTKYNYSTNFFIDDNKGYLEIFKDGNKIDEIGIDPTLKSDDLTLEESPLSNLNYYHHLLFHDIGSYEFEFKYIVGHKKSDNTAKFNVARTDSLYNISTSNNQSDRANSIDMIIFGYQLYYSDGLTDEKEFRNRDTKHYSDFTFTKYTNDGYDGLYYYDSKLYTSDTYNEDNELIKDSTIFEYNTEDESEDKYTYNVSSTNQAPVRLRGDGELLFDAISSESFYIFTPVNDGISEIIDYTNETQFTQNGTYELFVVYDFFNYKRVLGSNEIDFTGQQGVRKHYQLFKFEISNSPPRVSLDKYNENNEGIEKRLSSNSYTNYNIAANWTNVGPFDVAPTAMIYKSDFNGYNPYTDPDKFSAFSISGSTSYKPGTVLSDNGHYILRIYYGKSNNTFITLRFTIDKDPAPNIELHEVDIAEINDVDGYYIINEEEIIESNILGVPFTLGWNTKYSGAPISTKYSYTPLSYNDSHSLIQIDKLEEDGIYAIPNGHFLDNTFSNMSFNGDGSIEHDTRLSSNKVFNDPSIYRFSLIDAAGNISERLVVLDNTRAHIINDNPNQNIYNIYATDTTLTWGTHKALEIKDIDSLNLSQFEIDQYVIDSDSDDKNFFIIPIEKVSVAYRNEDNIYEEIGEYNPKNDPEDIMVTFYAEIDEDNNFYGEKDYAITVFPKTFYSDTNTQSVYSNTIIDITINLDRSMGMAISNERRSLFDRATNGNLLEFQFVQGSAEYLVTSLTYDFYPFYLDKQSLNYPFTTEAAISGSNILSSSYIFMPENSDEEYYRTLPINTTFIDGSELTIQGKYVFTRIYNNDESTAKTYTIYIDRNQIIQQDSNYLIGESIKIDIGDEIEFNNFLIETTRNIFFNTNFLPVDLFIPSSKYGFVKELNFDADDWNDHNNLSYHSLDNKTVLNFLENIFSLNIIIYKTSIHSSIIRTDIIYDTQAMASENGQVPIDIFTEPGKYDIVIFDNSGFIDREYDGTGITNSTDNINPNNFTISFEIEHKEPTGTYMASYINSANKTITYPLTNRTSTNDEALMFTFTDPDDIYMARIDTDDITVRAEMLDTGENLEIFRSGEESDYDVLFESEDIGKIGSSDKTRYKHTIRLFNKHDETNNSLYGEEIKFTVSIKYIGDELNYYDEDSDKNFGSSSISMIIDKTPPIKNLERLLEKDTFLSPDQKAMFFEEKLQDGSINQYSYLNYSFSIDTNFFFKYFDKLETNEIYYRVYDKYEDGSTNLQSLVPEHIHYNNFNAEPTRLRFSRTLTADNGALVYRAFNYNSPGDTASFNSKVLNSSNRYFEIIEIDEAGNHRNYTIHITNKNTQIIYDIINKNDLSENNQKLDNETGLDPLQGLELKLREINTPDAWYNITITNINTGAENSFENNPFIDRFDLFEQLNEFLTVDPDDVGNGITFAISIETRTTDKMDFEFRIPGRLLTPDVSEEYADIDNDFEITIPVDEFGTTYLTDLRVFRIEDLEEIELYSDHNIPGKDIIGNNPGGETYMFLSGEYIFRMIDNFGRSYDFTIIAGIENRKEVNLDNDYTAVKESKTYTSDTIEILFQTQLYQLKVYKNDDFMPLDSHGIFTVTNNETGIQTVRINQSLTERNTVDKYEISFTDSTQTSHKTVVYMYNLRPRIILEDTLGTPFPEDMLSTSRTVYLRIETDNIFPFTSSLIREYSGENGQPQMEYIGEVVEMLQLSKSGKYTLSFTNEINQTMQREWTINDPLATIFSVISDPQGLSHTITSSGVQFEYDNTLIESFFVLEVPGYDDYTIQTNPDREIEVSRIDEINQTKIYYLKSLISPYERIIAVTVVEQTDSIFKDNIILNEENTLSGTSYRTTENNISMAWNKYHIYAGNTIYADYYYNGDYVGRIYDNKVELKDAGIYRFEFYDLAGNKHSFAPRIDFFDMKVLNEVIYTTNDDFAIKDVAYNEPVIISVLYEEEYRSRSIELTAKLNGKEIDPQKEKFKYTYNFTEFGHYAVTIRALVSLGTGTEDIEIISNHEFIISNPKQSRYSFDYNPSSGYEIINIIKDGVNITTHIREQLETTSLSQLYLSSNTTGNGLYTILVRSSSHTLKPERNFEFSVWINNETPLITPSIEKGDTTTRDIELSFNKYLIFQQVGESIVTVNGVETIFINGETSAENIVSTLELTSNNDYIIQVQNSYGDVLYSFKVTKKAPLNNTAIFIILSSSFALIALVFTYVKLRHKMKVS